MTGGWGGARPLSEYFNPEKVMPDMSDMCPLPHLTLPSPRQGPGSYPGPTCQPKLLTTAGSVASAVSSRPAVDEPRPGGTRTRTPGRLPRQPPLSLFRAKVLALGEWGTPGVVSATTGPRSSTAERLIGPPEAIVPLTDRARYVPAGADTGAVAGLAPGTRTMLRFPVEQLTYCIT